MSRSPSTRGEPRRAIDRHVGRRLRERRTELGLSQIELAAAVGVTFQQIQKYERGANRIVASRLYQLAKALGVPVEYFFADPPPEESDRSPTAPDEAEQSHPSDRETRDLVTAYYQIIDSGLRRKLIDLVRSVARSET